MTRTETRIATWKLRVWYSSD